MKYFDSHAHISYNDYSADEESMIKRSLNNDVTHIMSNADALESFDMILSTKRKYPSVCHAAVGVHPEFSGRGKEYIDKAIEFIRFNKDEIDAIGECGLDYHYLDGTTKEEEMNTFRRMAVLANELDKPLVVHSREAFEDTYAILRDVLPRRIQLHCYCYGEEEARAFLRLKSKVMFSFGGVLTFKNSIPNQKAFLSIPIDSIMLETDSPCLAPVPYRGKRNEPSYIPLIFNKMCSLLNLNEYEQRERLADKIYRNTMDFFGLKD